MSSFLGDIGSLFITAGNTQPSSAVVTNVTGAGVDFQTCADNQCFAIQRLGLVTGTEITFLGKIQEAPNITSGYTDISGATFTTITSTTGQPGISAINFQRTQPFLRYIGTIAGTTSGVSLDVILAGRKKQTP